MSEDPYKGRSPRAVRNERQARVTRLILGALVVLVLGGAGWGVTWLRKERERARTNGMSETAASSAPETKPASAESAPTTSRASRPARAYKADETIAGIRARFQDGSVEGVWQAAQALRAEAGSWRTEGAPEADVNRLLAAVLDSETWILNTKPSFPDLRQARGEVRWPEVMGEYEDFDTRFLTKAEAERLGRFVKQFDQAAERNHGWIVLAEYEAGAGPLVRKSQEARKVFDAALKTRTGRGAREIEIRDVAELKTLLPGARFRAFYHLPYLFLVEEDDGWEEQEAAQSVARTMLGLRKTFFDVYGHDMSLAPADQRPVAVLLLKSREEYHRYCSKRGVKDVISTEAHFEPRTEPPSERLVIHRDCALSTLLHEGTHQLIRANIRAPLTTYTQSFWFHEGIAEWFGGSREIAAGQDGLPRFEIGLLKQEDVTPGRVLGPIAILRSMPPENRIPLRKLIGMMLSDRDLYVAQGADGLRKIDLVYAQGWFLIYFLDHFSVDEHGIVQVGAPGTYRGVWLDYLKREFEAHSGEATFLAALGPANVTLEKIESQMNAYLDFLASKIAKGHVRDQKLLPWTAVLGPDSRPSATIDDDRLVPK